MLHENEYWAVLFSLHQSLPFIPSKVLRQENRPFSELAIASRAEINCAGLSFPGAVVDSKLCTFTCIKDTSIYAHVGVGEGVGVTVAVLVAVGVGVCVDVGVRLGAAEGVGVAPDVPPVGESLLVLSGLPPLGTAPTCAIVAHKPTARTTPIARAT